MRPLVEKKSTDHGHKDSYSSCVKPPEELKKKKRNSDRHRGGEKIAVPFEEKEKKEAYSVIPSQPLLSIETLSQGGVKGTWTQTEEKGNRTVHSPKRGKKGIRPAQKFQPNSERKRGCSKKRTSARRGKGGNSLPDEGSLSDHLKERRREGRRKKTAGRKKRSVTTEGKRTNNHLEGGHRVEKREMYQSRGEGRVATWAQKDIDLILTKGGICDGRTAEEGCKKRPGRKGEKKGERGCSM